jgi:transposase
MWLQSCAKVWNNASKSTKIHFSNKNFFIYFKYVTYCNICLQPIRNVFYEIPRNWFMLCMITGGISFLEMAPHRELHPTIRAQIIALHQHGVSQTDIARQHHVSQSCVCKTIQRHRSLRSFSSRRRTGRPSATTRQDDSAMLRIVTRFPAASSTYIASQLPPGVKVSRDTIRRRLRNKFGLTAHRPSRKPLLSAKNIRDRLAFCRKYSSWSPAQWQSVLFSDESTIRQFHNPTQFIRRPSGARYDDHYTIPSVKHSPSLMVWGAISSSGTTPLWFLPKGQTMNASVYLPLLQDVLSVQMPRLGCTVYQQDNAPCHTAKKVKSWLHNNHIPLLDWPASSPDLNPIENCWTLLKKKVSEKNPTSLSDLKAKINETWNEFITPAYCTTLVSSMPRRIKAVLKARGSHTKY